MIKPRCHVPTKFATIALSATPVLFVLGIALLFPSSPEEHELRGDVERTRLVSSSRHLDTSRGPKCANGAEDVVGVQDLREVRDLDDTIPLTRPDLNCGAAQEASPEQVLRIVNPYANGYRVQFLLNGELIALEPGDEYMASHTPSPWQLRFHRGADYGEADYTLLPGTHEFRVCKQGWWVEYRP